MRWRSLCNRWLGQSRLHRAYWRRAVRRRAAARSAGMPPVWREYYKGSARCYVRLGDFGRCQRWRANRLTDKPAQTAALCQPSEGSRSYVEVSKRLLPGQGMR